MSNEIVEEALSETREELAEEDREKHLVKAVKMLDNVEASIQEKDERFKDWYALHFPELIEEVNDIEHLTKILKDSVDRNDLDSFSELADKSTGAEIGEQEKKLIESVLENLESDLELREELEDYISEVVKEEMPNLSKFLGTFLTAKMIASVGSLEELAKKPASTVQMIGAEEALFRYLRGNGTSPKHGIIFEHEFVRPLPSKPRGKMARFIANKAVMAARLDAYSEKDNGAELKEEAREKFEELKEA